MANKTNFITRVGISGLSPPIWVLVLALAWPAARVALGGVVYPEPPGGWTYIYDGNQADPYVTAALDGTWDHKPGSDGSDAWDGSGHRRDRSNPQR